MKKFLGLIVWCALACIVVPIGLLKEELYLSSLQESGVEKTEQVTEAPATQSTISVFRSASKETEEIELFEYVCGSVAAEMPLSYEEEALKAQAIACQTNALRLRASSDSESAHITDDPAVHQGYLSPEERKKKWGDDFQKYEDKLQAIVAEVENQVITYKGELCVAAFHAISSGTTETSQTLWGKNLPYLESVKSSGDILSPNYASTVSFNLNEFNTCTKKLGLKKDFKTLKDAIKTTKTSQAGTVTAAVIDKTTFSGEEIRSAFSLKSANFTVEATKNTVTFSVKGYGHGVGMSQYGADFMARQGSTCKEILQHYYSDCEIENF